MREYACLNKRSISRDPTGLKIPCYPWLIAKATSLSYTFKKTCYHVGIKFEIIHMSKYFKQKSDWW